MRTGRPKAALHITTEDTFANSPCMSLAAAALLKTEESLNRFDALWDIRNLWALRRS